MLVRYYALAAANALVAHLEDNLSISFAPNTLRVYYRGTEETVIIGGRKSVGPPPTLCHGIHS